MTHHKINPEILREYDIRGTFEKNLSCDDAYAVGLRFGSYVKQNQLGSVIIGYDGRLSTPDLKSHLERGLHDVGVDCVDIGCVPTPVVYYALVGARLGSIENAGARAVSESMDSDGIKLLDENGEFQAAIQSQSSFQNPAQSQAASLQNPYQNPYQNSGQNSTQKPASDPGAAIMITGSHNPKDDNGFKITLKNRPFFGANIRSLNDVNIVMDDVCGTTAKREISNDYVNRITRDFVPSHKKFKIAIDPGHGATADIIHDIVRVMGIDAVIINGTIDGTFPAHHPDPTLPENLQQLMDCVRDHNCDMGIAFDGDGDRIGAVDHAGNIFYGDQLMMIYAKDILSRHPGATMIADVKTSQTTFDTIRKHGGNPLMWKTGHSLIKSKMKETGAMLAGETSGHIFINDGYYGYDDALYAAVRLIDIVMNSGESFHMMYDMLPKLYSTPDTKIFVDDAEKFKIVAGVVDQLRSENANFSDIDGARVNHPQGWWLIRASNTQNCLVIRAESPTKKGLLELQQEIDVYLGKLKIKV